MTGRSTTRRPREARVDIWEDAGSLRVGCTVAHVARLSSCAFAKTVVRTEGVQDVQPARVKEAAWSLVRVSIEKQRAFCVECPLQAVDDVLVVRHRQNRQRSQWQEQSIQRSLQVRNLACRLVLGVPPAKGVDVTVYALLLLASRIAETMHIDDHWYAVLFLFFLCNRRSEYAPFALPCQLF